MVAAYVIDGRLGFLKVANGEQRRFKQVYHLSFLHRRAFVRRHSLEHRLLRVLKVFFFVFFLAHGFVFDVVIRTKNIVALITK